ncbi:hypothetical protein AMTRI_Chr09g19830 [Amborella trichopoda]
MYTRSHCSRCSHVDSYLEFKWLIYGSEYCQGYQQAYIASQCLLPSKRKCPFPSNKRRNTNLSLLPPRMLCAYLHANFSVLLYRSLNSSHVTLSPPPQIQNPLTTITHKHYENEHCSNIN